MLWENAGVTLDLLPALWTYFEPLIGLTTLLFAFRIWVRTRRVRRHVQQSGVGGPPLLLNFSDHRVTGSQAHWTRDYLEYHYPLQLTLDSTEALEFNLVRVIQGLPGDILARLRAADPALVIVPPGAASGLLMLEPILHGIAGQFLPAAYWLRTNHGFILSRPIDRQRLRWRVRGQSVPVAIPNESDEPGQTVVDTSSQGFLEG